MNVHLHTLIPDGVFVTEGDGPAHFFPIPQPSDEDVAAILARIVRRAAKVLVGFDDDIELATPMIENSDNVAAYQLFLRVGGRDVAEGTFHDGPVSRYEATNALQRGHPATWDSRSRRTSAGSASSIR